MNERIKELALSNGIYDCLCDPYDKFKTGDDYGSVMWDLQRFAELIVRECAGIAYEYDIPNLSGPGEFIGNRMKKHFGVEE